MALRLFLFLFFGFYPALSLDAFGGNFSSDWQAHIGGRSRLIIARVDSGAGSEGIFVGLELDLASGWHSYWRVPGASGIAPEFDWRGSRGVAVGSATFTAPYFIDDGAGGIYGYSDHVIFPFSVVRTDTDATLHFTAHLGVCRDLCVPITSVFKLTIPPVLSGSPFEAQILDALMHAPQMPQSRLRSEQISYDGLALQFTITGRDLSAVRVMPITGDGLFLGDQRVVARSAESWLIEFPVINVVGRDIVGDVLDFIIRDGDFAVEQRLEVRHHVNRSYR